VQLVLYRIRAFSHAGMYSSTDCGSESLCESTLESFPLFIRPRPQPAAARDCTAGELERYSDGKIPLDPITYFTRTLRGTVWADIGTTHAWSRGRSLSEARTKGERVSCVEWKGAKEVNSGRPEPSKIYATKTHNEGSPHSSSPNLPPAMQFHYIKLILGSSLSFLNKTPAIRVEGGANKYTGQSRIGTPEVT